MLVLSQHETDVNGSLFFLPWSRLTKVQVNLLSYHLTKALLIILVIEYVD